MLQVNRFFDDGTRLQVNFRPFICRHYIAGCPVGAAVFRVSGNVLVAIVKSDFRFKILVLGVFLIHNTIFRPGAFTFRVNGHFMNVFFNGRSN